MAIVLEVPTRARPRPASVLEGLSPEQRRSYARIPTEIDYVDHPLFADPQAEARLFGGQADSIQVQDWTHFPEAPDDFEPRGKARVALSGRDEATLFLRYNYARYRLSRLLAAQARRKSAGRARQLLLWFHHAQETRADLVRANMALVVAMAKRTRIPNVDFPELISEGNLALLRSVEKFDVARGFKFSTYACRAILKSFNRMATKTGRYRQRFCTEFDPDLERSDYDVHKHEMKRDQSLDALREILARNRADLSEVERTVVMERFAIGSEGKRRTLAEVGRMVGLTNERIRQIQNLALDKIRAVLDDQYLVA